MFTALNFETVKKVSGVDGSRGSVVTVHDYDKSVMTVERTREEEKDDQMLQNE